MLKENEKNLVLVERVPKERMTVVERVPKERVTVVERVPKEEMLQLQQSLSIPNVEVGMPPKSVLDQYWDIGAKFRKDCEGNLYYRTINSQSICLCNFTVEIKKIFHLHFSDGKVKVYVWAIVPKFGFEEFVEDSKFSFIMQNFIDKYPKLYVPAEFRQNPRQYFQEYAATIYPRIIQPEEVYLYHGWECVADKMRYVSTDSRFDGTNTHFSDMVGYQMHLPDISNFREKDIWNLGRKLLAIGYSRPEATVSLKAILPIFLYLHLGYAAKLFQDAGKEVQFILLITGPSGSLKTALCQAIAEPFNPDGMLNFQSTDRAIELYRKRSTDMMMIMDDIFSMQDRASETKFQRLLRTFGDSIGRAKAINTSVNGNYNATERIMVRGGCIVTGEHRPNAQQSSNLRMVQVEVERDTFNKKFLSEIQNNNLYSRRQGQPSWVQLYFTGWISQLEKNYDRYVDFISGLASQENTQFNFKRQESSFLLLYAVAVMILDWGCEVHAITTSEKEGKLALWKDAIIATLKTNEEYALGTEPYQEFLQALVQGIGAGNILIARDKSEYEFAKGRYVGFERWIHGEQQYVLVPELVFLSVRKWIEGNGQTLMANNSSICKALYQHKITRGYDKNSDGKGRARNRYYKRIQLNGRSVEMLVMIVDAMDQVIKEA